MDKKTIIIKKRKIYIKNLFLSSHYETTIRSTLTLSTSFLSCRVNGLDDNLIFTKLVKVGLYGIILKGFLLF